MNHPPPKSVYLDYNATAPMLPAALERMAETARNVPGNPSSPHRAGQAARSLLEESRSRLAAALGCAPREVVLTSGGSEGNNTVLRWLAEQEPPVHMIATPIEHPSVLRTCEWLAGRGVAVSYLPVDAEGRIDPEAAADLVRPETRLVTAMAANNETGVLQPIDRLARTVRRAQQRPILLHADAVQYFGRHPGHPGAWDVDAVTVTAHKLGGPKGIGALIVREGSPCAPLITGGRQERDRRAGTESPALAAAFAAAADWWVERQPQIAEELRVLRDGLVRAVADEGGFFLNGAGAERLPNTANLGFEGVEAQSLITALDLDGIAVSAGSACSSGSLAPSAVLRAMGLPEARVEAAVRISLGPETTTAEVARCAERLLHHVRRIRAGRPALAGG